MADLHDLKKVNNDEIEEGLCKKNHVFSVQEEYTASESVSGDKESSKSDIKYEVNKNAGNLKESDEKLSSVKVPVKSKANIDKKVICNKKKGNSLPSKGIKTIRIVEDPVEKCKGSGMKRSCFLGMQQSGIQHSDLRQRSMRVERSYSDSDLGRLALRLSIHSNNSNSEESSTTSTSSGSSSEPNTAPILTDSDAGYGANSNWLRNIVAQVRDMDDDDFDIHVDIMDHAAEITTQPSVQQFPKGDSEEAECGICYTWKPLHLRLCCRFPACDSCLDQFCSIQVGNGILRIPCVSTDCDQFMHRDEVTARLSAPFKEKFYKFLVDANKDPNIKTCPRCSHVLKIDIELVRNPTHKKKGLQVICSKCGLLWCFPCQAPWHENVNCKEFRKGDKLLAKWAREHSYGQANAQKCPKCKVFIQRSSGCDHMVCTRCKTNFCYRCGDKYRDFKFIGDHYSRFSIFGCKYRFKPDQPMERKAIRGAIFGGKMLAAPVVTGFAIVAGVALLGVGVLALPFYAGYKIHKQIEMEKRRKRRRQAAREWRAKVEAIRKKGEELEISMHHTKSDNIDEIMNSYMEHSIIDDINVNFDDSDSSSDLDSGVKVTEVKVITAIISPDFHDDECSSPEPSPLKDKVQRRSVFYIPSGPPPTSGMPSGVPTRELTQGVPADTVISGVPIGGQCAGVPTDLPTQVGKPSINIPTDGPPSGTLTDVPMLSMHSSEDEDRDSVDKESTTSQPTLLSQSYKCIKPCDQANQQPSTNQSPPNDDGADSLSLATAGVLSWTQCVAMAPYADEESFSIYDGEEYGDGADGGGESPKQGPGPDLK